MPQFSFSPTSPRPQRSIGITLFLYANTNGVPGEVIWSGRELVGASSAQVHHVPVVLSPNVSVPDTVFLALEYDAYSAAPSSMSPGILIKAQPPLVGSAGAVPLVQDSTTLEWSPDPWSNPNQYVLQARFTAEDPPASCYRNCDGSTTAPILNLADCSCFLTKFAAGDSYGNCDGSRLAHP